MNYRNIIFCKPTGLNANLVHLLICNDYCIKNNCNLIFFIQENQLEFAKKLNTIAQFIIVDKDYCNFCCSSMYKNTNYTVFSLKLKYLIKKQYLTSLDINDTFFFNGYNQDLHNIPQEYTNVLLFKMYKDELKNIQKKSFIINNNFNIVFNSFRNDILSFNLVNVGGDQQLVYEFWDFIINKKIRHSLQSKLFFVSGNRQMLKYFSNKYSGLNSTDDKLYETVFSRTFSSNINKGCPNDIFYDIINCSFTNFQSLHSLRHEFPEITSIFKDVNFINRTEHFDFLVEYFIDNIKIL